MCQRNKCGRKHVDVVLPDSITKCGEEFLFHGTVVGCIVCEIVRGNFILHKVAVGSI